MAGNENKGSDGAGRILIAFFSRPGNNYVAGRIVDLPVGNTEVAAGLVRELTGGELFRIDPVKKYDADYRVCTEEAQRDQRADARPELTAYPGPLEDCGTVILCYPNYWGTMPMPVFTFLERTAPAGKRILPLCTNEGSGLGRSEADIRRLCPAADVRPGLSVRGGGAAGARDAIRRWLGQNGL